MSKDIYIPEGEELMRCLNEGGKICNECGAIMEPTANDLEYGLICPNCGWGADSMEYEYDYGEELELAPNIVDMFGGEVIPDCCAACGGPYPDCMGSCKIFDD